MKNTAVQTTQEPLLNSPQDDCARPDSSNGSHHVSRSNENYAVVIPAYNERATIRNVALKSLQFIDRVIIIDDGSVDDTSTMIEDLPVTILKNPCNMGKAASLWRGFQHALTQNVQAVITLDGDGQHSPDDLPRLMAQANVTPHALVIGAREGSWDRASWHRRLANKIADFWISWASGYPISDSQSGFRVYPSCLLHQTTLEHDKKRSFVFESEILIEGAKLGYYSYPVSIDSLHRMAIRPSHFRPVLDIVRITKMVAWKLLSRGMYLDGLYRSLQARSNHIHLQQKTQPSSPPILSNRQ